MALTSCHKRREIVALPPTPIPPVVVRVENPTPVYSPIPTSLPPYVSPPAPGAAERDQADRAFIAGRYDEAIQGYENFLQISSGGDGRDEALFRLGLCYALRED